MHASFDVYKETKCREKNNCLNWRINSLVDYPAESLPISSASFSLHLYFRNFLQTISLESAESTAVIHGSLSE